MKKSDLVYSYPEELIATEPSRPSRVMWVESNLIHEINMDMLVEKIPKNDVVVINNTKVLKRRIFTEDGLEILFLDKINSFDKHEIDDHCNSDQKNKTVENSAFFKKNFIEAQKSNCWKVLFPSKKINKLDKIKLPFGFTMTLLEKGRPQIVEVEPAIYETDFEKMGELPLPPYIQKARSNRHNVIQDESWYQTAWAEKPGSFAAPTASLHWQKAHIDRLKDKGVQIIEVTLHVGLGTFLPVTTEDLNQHEMHYEFYEIAGGAWEKILEAKKKEHKIWCLGTTAARTVESVARFKKLSGETNLLLQEGSEFLIVDRLMTNFHQPESTLLAMVAGFYGLENVKMAYQWAIDKKFKLFSYGDFSVWIK